MRRLLAAAAASLAVAAAAAPGAGAKVIEVGQTSQPGVPTCPGKPCLAVPRTTGYQAKVGTKRGLMTIPRAGRIVAWTVTLSKPGPTQVKFFEKNLGGPAQAGISILKPGKRLYSRVMAVSPIVALTPFFGTTVQFPLDRTLPVHRGWVVALTVPTWAPALVVGLGNDTSWRAARPKGKCNDTQADTSQREVKDIAQYYCLYRTARLAYSATLVTNPQPATQPKKSG